MRKASVTVVISLILVALLLPLGSGVWGQKGPIKVGLLVPQTGPLAANGKDMINGLQLYFEEQGNRLAGREIKLIIEDDKGKPATGLTKARGLVEEQAVHVLMGPLSAAIGYAVAPYIDGKKVPAIFPIVSPEDITQRKRSPYIVRTGWSSAQPSHPFGKWVYDNLGYTRIAMTGYDFAFGWEVAAGFQRTFEEASGQVVQKLWPPLGTADFGPYLAQLRRDVDAIYAVFSGADALRFAKQFRDVGLKGRLPLIGGGTFTDEHVLRTMGDEALGIVTALHYSAGLATPANRKFAQAYEAKFKQVPYVLLGRDVRGRDRPQGGARGDGGRCRERRPVPVGASQGRPVGRPARADALRRLRQPDPERVRAEGGEGRRAAPELGDPHDPERVPVLDVQA
jgi:branched-chain amino acid transport system substrate-binding protein